MIEMIVTDLDGTLLNSNKELSDYNRDVLIRAQEQGLALVLATGRNVYTLDGLVAKLKMADFKSGYLIGVNGLQLYEFESDTYHKEEPLSEDEVERIHRLLNENDYSVFYFSDEKTVCGYNFLMNIALKIGFLKSKMRRIIASSAAVEIEYVLNGEVAVARQNKICFIAFNPYKLQKIKRELDRDFTLLQVGRHWVEIIPKNVSKARRLETIITNKGLDFDRVAVFGDSENDVDMLRLGPHGYVPANGLVQAKKVAREIIPSNNDNGVGKTVAQLLKANENMR